jgi:hypothetical protein
MENAARSLGVAEEQPRPGGRGAALQPPDAVAAASDRKPAVRGN